MSEESLLNTLSIDNVRAHVAHIVTDIPSRLAGSENGKRMADYSCEALRRNGVEAVVHTLPGLVSFPDVAACRVLSPVELSLPANS